MNAMTSIVAAKRPEVEFRKGDTTRLQPIRAFKAVSRLMADKEDTAAVFDLMRALAGKALPNGYARLLKTPRGGRIAYERDELNDRLMDRAWLESFAPGTVGAVPLTITVDDGKGMTATDTVTVQVIAPAAKKQITFEDVHFDFDRFSLRPEATRILDEAIKAMQEDPNPRITVEGHTCNIGTTEYNLALGERRSAAVRDYLVGRGINASRLQTVSYGEERPKHDNSREETRRLNRRAAMTIRLQ